MIRNILEILTIDNVLILSVTIFIILHLWMVLLAFHKSIYWGLVCLFGNIFGTLAFSTETWEEQKYVVIIYFASFIAIISSLITMTVQGKISL
jgi:hypothetical protein